MKYLLTLIVCAVVLQVHAQQPLQKGNAMPDFELVKSNGEKIQASEIKSELLIIDFWAGWCKPCIKTIKSTLLPLYQKYERHQLEIVGVSYDKSEEKWKKSIERFKLPWLHVYDGTSFELYEKYNIEIIPTYYVVNREGEILATNLLSTDLESFVSNYFNNQ